MDGPGGLDNNGACKGSRELAPVVVLLMADSLEDSGLRVPLAHDMFVEMPQMILYFFSQDSSLLLGQVLFLNPAFLSSLQKKERARQDEAGVYKQLANEQVRMQCT